MSNQQQYVKNTNKPDAESYLWSLGNNWKISGKTGDVYCPLKFDQQKEISNLELFTKMMGVLDGPIEKLDYAEIKGFYFLPARTQDGDPLLYVYTELDKVEKKKANTIKYAGQQQQQQQPQQQTTPSNQNTTLPGVSTVSTLAPRQATITVDTANRSLEDAKQSVLLKQDHIITYTDPNWVEGGSDEARTLESKGYSYIPRSLATTTGRLQSIYNEEGTEIGQKSLYLMGRIINVKIVDK